MTDQCAANDDTRPKWRRRSRDENIMEWFGGPDYCGNNAIPGDHLKLDVPMHGGTDPDDVKVYRTLNDGFELYMGYPHEWRWSMDHDEARKVAWFILWTWWAKGTWFGLRRKIWYGALHRHVNRFKGYPRG